ncbi:MAG: hypothetical protein AAF467_11170 [Actinomycetota bacterium]
MTGTAPAAGLAIGPRRHERPSDRAMVTLGVLDGTSAATVDGGGLVAPTGVAWSLDWWIGADDRWYLPAREATVRQGRQGVGPVVETTMRIPSGNARHVAYSTLVDGAEVTVIEIHNESPVPVALALAVRPYRPTGSPAASLSITTDGERHLIVDDRVAVVLPRRPNESGASEDTDLLSMLTEGDPLAWPAAGRVDGPAANAVALYPLPHRTSLRVVVPHPPDDAEWSARSSATLLGTGAAPDPAAAPDPEQIARGWSSVLDAAARVELPDDGLSSRLGAARSRMLLASSRLPAALTALEPGAGALLGALAAMGHRTGLELALAAIADTFPSRLVHGPVAAAEIVAALDTAVVVSGRAVDDALLEVAMQLTHLVAKSRDADARITAERGLAALARRAGNTAAAGRLERSLPAPDLADLAAVVDLAEAASAAGAWPAPVDGAAGALHAQGPSPLELADDGDDPAAAARFVAAVRDLVVDDRGDDVDLMPGYPSAWRGGNGEVHRLPTRHGLVSYGIRWHGARPALLWEADDGVRLRCSALDPEWSTTDARGETLLTGAADALGSAPAAGESFS